MKGSAGSMTFRIAQGSTVVSEKATQVKNPRTAAQQRQRMKWANVVQMYRGIAPLLNCGFESKQPRVSDYNMFVKLNNKVSPVYLTKAEASAGACVVAPYQLTQGTLPSIATTGEGADRVTDIRLGDLTVTADTTVSQFAAAVVQHNAAFDYGDQISYFTVLQQVNALTDIPYAVFQASSVVLKKESNVKLWDLVHPVGFATKDGCLAHGSDEGDGAYCWVHSRKKNGRTLVSSQQLLDHNALLADYTSPAAYERAVATYGGENQNFLVPDVESSGSVSGGTSGGSGSSGGGSGDEEEVPFG